MNLKISGKFIFAVIVIILVLSFALHDLIPSSNNVIKKNDNNNDINITKQNKKIIKKIFGVKIQKENESGIKYLIVADTIKENEDLKKSIELENAITTINKKGNVTKIFAGFALISNDYETINLSKKVKIIKNNKNFQLKTSELNGNLEKGNFFTDKEVHIVSGNTTITGKGLEFLNQGEYIKVKGKVKVMTKLQQNNDN